MNSLLFIVKSIGPVIRNMIKSITPLITAVEKVCLIFSKSPSRESISPDFLTPKKDNGNFKICDKYEKFNCKSVLYEKCDNKTLRIALTIH